MDKKVLSWRQLFGLLLIAIFLVGYGISLVNVQPSTPDWVRWSVGLMVFSWMMIPFTLRREDKKNAK